MSIFNYWREQLGNIAAERWDAIEDGYSCSELGSFYEDIGDDSHRWHPLGAGASYTLQLSSKDHQKFSGQRGLAKIKCHRDGETGHFEMLDFLPLDDLFVIRDKLTDKTL